MRKAIVCIICAFALAASCALSGCFGIKPEPTVAATVYGETISEEEVTAYVDDFRATNDEYQTDSGWAQYLADSSKTASTFRDYLLDTIFIPRVLIRQQCKEKGIVITEEQLDTVIEQEKEYYESRYGADSWDSVLAAYGYTQETWRENEEMRLLETRLKSEVVGSIEPNQSQIQQKANENAVLYNGKHSYYIVFQDEESAKRVRSSLVRNGSTITKKAFKKAGNAENAGWNSLPDDKAKMSTEYINALNDIDALEVSEPVASGSYYLLIFCDSIFNVEKDDSFVKLSSIPQSILKQITADTEQDLVNKAFDEYLEELANSSEVVKEPMPENVSYNVNSARNSAG